MSSDIEVQLARDAAHDPAVFAALADMAEERGTGEDLCRAIRRLPETAAAIAAAIKMHRDSGCVIRQLQVTRHGSWTLFLASDPRPPESRDPEDRRGHSADLEFLVVDYDEAFAALDAFGVALGFTSFESLRVQNGAVLQIRYGYETE